MKTDIECPFCGEKYEVDESQANAPRMECGKCGRKFENKNYVQNNKAADEKPSRKPTLADFSTPKTDMDAEYNSAMKIVLVFDIIAIIAFVIGIVAILAGASYNEGGVVALGFFLVIIALSSFASSKVLSVFILSLRHSCEAECMTREYQRKMLEYMQK